MYDRKHVGSRTKEAPVELRITYNKKQKYISTGVRVLPRYWKYDSVCNTFDAAELNGRLETMIKNVRRIINTMQEAGDINIDEIPSRLRGVQSGGLSFIEYCEKRISVRKYGLKNDSAERYDRFLRFFRKWGGIIWFGDVTDENVLKFDKALGVLRMKDNSKWHNYHRFLNSFIIDAVNEGYVRRNPYKWVRISKGESGEGLAKYLTEDEFNTLANCECELASMERVRDLFIFQTWTCLSYVDLAAFDATGIVDINGRKMYKGRRGKTGQEYSILLLQPALNILNKYNGVLPVLSNQKYNDTLKMLGYKCHIDKPISTHWARHTGATMLLNSGVDMEVVAKVLGHSSTKITRSTYAKLLDDTVAKEMIKMERNS